MNAIIKRYFFLFVNVCEFFLSSFQIFSRVISRRHLLLIIPCVFFSISVFSQSAICSYKYRKRITFDPAKVIGPIDLNNFPVVINIASDNDLRTVANSGHLENANGYDIIFTADDGVTKLDHHLECYSSTTGQLTAWVRIPVLFTSMNTYIYMYYGNTAIAADQSLTSTWDNNYKGVWHLCSTNFNDATSNGNNGINNGSSDDIAGQIAGGRKYTAPGNYVQVGLANCSNAQGSVELWGQGTTFLTSTYFFGETTLQDGSYADMLQLYIGNVTGTDGVLCLGMGSDHVLNNNVATLSQNLWYHIVLTWSGGVNGTYIVYVNGVQVATGNYINFNGMHSFADIGNDGNAGQRTQQITGSVDEVKISDNQRSADWIATAYNNQQSPSTFYSVSVEPKRWIGITNTNWNMASNWAGGVVPVAYDDVTVTNTTPSNQQTLNVGSVQVSSLWIQPGATVFLVSNSLSVAFDITNCGTITGNNSLVTFNSTSTKIQNQYISGSGTYNLNKLTVNNTFSPSPKLILKKNVDMSRLLTLTSGIVYTTTTNILALGFSATSTTGSATSFVSGPMSKYGTANFVFPVGKGTWWRRVGISVLTDTATFRAEYFDTAFSNIITVNYPLYDVSAVEYWQLDRIVDTGNANVTLYWENAGLSGINSCPDLTIAHWNGESWDERPSTTSVGSVCSGAGVGTVVSNAAITTFSPFTFGTKSPSNPLPLTLLSLTALPKAGEVELKWTTATETNNDYFTVEKSRDGTNFESFAQIDGAGNSITVLKYSCSDINPYQCVSYYRLKQTDYNGTFTYSNLVAVDFENKNLNFLFNIYPNPTDGYSIGLEISSEKGEEIPIVVLDILGKEIFSVVITLKESGDNLFTIYPEKKLSPGMYFIKAISMHKEYIKKIIIE